MEQLYTTEEVLTFTIDTAQSAVSASDLIRYLSGLDERTCRGRAFGGLCSQSVGRRRLG